LTDYRTLSGAAFQREVGTDPDKWADAAMIAAEDLGYKIDRDWLRDLLADALDTASRHSMREVLKREDDPNIIRGDEEILGNPGQPP